jgi:nucleoid DNA-binding protein
MPHTPPIDIRELQKKGVLNEERFFKLLSQFCNYVPPETVKSFYFGLVSHITKELRENGVVRLPMLGDLALVKQKPKIGWAGKFQAILGGRYMLKFYPKETLREYFTKLSEKPGREGALDPREKLLNREL